MIFIAHRGNITGPEPEKENHPDHIQNALDKGFDVEIDVWIVKGKYLLGHNEPQYEVTRDFILNEKFWHHAKNTDALFNLNRINNYFINCFTHDQDDFTITSGGYIWTYPRNLPLNSDQSIAVMPERVPEWDWQKAHGVCTDYPELYKSKLGISI